MGRRALPRSLCLLLASLLLPTGCATVHPDPFGDFTASVQELRANAEVALQVNDEANRQRFVEEAVSDDEEFLDALEGLQMETVDEQPFDWSTQTTPLFLKSRRFRAGVYALNTALITYSELLRDLASPAELSTEGFESKTEDLNANLRAATGTLGVEADREISIFSAAAAELVRSHLTGRSRSTLRRILEENQTNIGELADHFQDAVSIARGNLWTNYDEGFAALQLQAIGGDADHRRKVLEGALALNEEFLTRLETLEALHAAYGAVPRAHRELIDAVQNPRLDKASLREIRANAKRLRALVRRMEEEE